MLLLTGVYLHIRSLGQVAMRVSELKGASVSAFHRVNLNAFKSDLKSPMKSRWNPLTFCDHMASSYQHFTFCFPLRGKSHSP